MQIYKGEINYQNLFRLNINNIFYCTDFLIFRNKKISRLGET